jgi:hypothetical protein
MKKLDVLRMYLLLSICLISAACARNSKQADEIHFPEALDKAAIIQDSISDVTDNSLLLGNGDINGLVNVVNDQLIIRLSKNDIGDWRNDTSTDSTLIPLRKLRELGAEGKLSTKARVMGWHRYAYACPIPCGRVVVNLPQGKNNQRAVLDLRRAVTRIGNTGQNEKSAATVRCLYQSNVFLIEGGTDANLFSHKVEHLPPAESGVSGKTLTLYQELPSDADWPGMAYAVALSVKGKRMAVAIVSSFDAKDPLAEAVALAEKTVIRKPQKLIADHESDWEAFWSKSGVQLDDEYLTSTWYRNLYFLRTVSRPETATIGLFAGLLSDGKPAWHSAHTMNYNAEQPFWSAFSCNHLELASSYRWLITRYMKNAKWLCKHLFDFDGIYFPHNIFTYNGDHAASRQAGNGVHMHYPWGYSTGITGWAGQNLWWEYEYGGRDTVFLREIYPILRDAALFYSNFINTCEKLPYGKVKYGPSVSPEHFGFSNDLSKNWNDIHALVFARSALETATKSAGVLKTDPELVKQFSNSLQMLPDYPTYGEGEDRVIVNVLGAEPVNCNIPVPVFPVFPGELVTYFSPEEEKTLLIRTIDKLQSNGNNDAMILCHARARLSMPGTYEYVVNSFKQRQRPNGTITLNVIGEKWQRYNSYGHYSEQFAASAVVSELLLQSVDEIIRVFPAWPADKNAGFFNLRAKGGFLVSSEYNGGKTVHVTITATADQPLRLLNPFKEQIYHSNIPVKEVDGEIQCQLSEGQKLHLTL